MSEMIEPAALKPPTRKRYFILALIFITVIINYLDRTNISVAADEIQGDLNLDDIAMGLVFSAFGWTYSPCQVPGGILADLFKPRKLYPILLTLWSFVTLLQAACTNTIGFVLCRLGIGAFEAPSYPINNRIVTNWFPENERASAIAIYTSAQFLGLAVMAPLLTYVQIAVGWQALFVGSGILGIAWAVIWYMGYRDPEDHQTISTEELQLIKDGGGMVSDATTADPTQRNQFQWHELFQVLGYRKLWAIYIGQFCLGTLFVFFMTWFMPFLKQTVKNQADIDLEQSAWLAGLPFLAAFVGVLLSGWSSDWMIRRKFSTEVARKAPVIVGMLLMMSVIGVNYTQSLTAMILILSLSFFGNGLASINWVFVSLMAPKKLIGLTGGVFNLFGGLAAILTPIVIGYLKHENDYSNAFVYICFVAFVGLCSYLFLLGKVERVEG